MSVLWLRRIQAVALKELRQMAHDRLTLAMIVGIPLLQMMIFGYGINFDVRHIRARASTRRCAPSPARARRRGRPRPSAAVRRLAGRAHAE